MGKRGPKKKPTNLESLEGFPGKRRRNVREPKPTSAGVRCPRWLAKDAIARGEWNRLEEELRRLGLLTVVDVTVFAAYCKWYARWRRWEDKLDEAIKASNGASGDLVIAKSGYAQQSPYVSMAAKAYENMLKVADRFGFTPSSRSGLGLPLDPTAPVSASNAPLPPKTDEFEQFLRKERTRGPNP